MRTFFRRFRTPTYLSALSLLLAFVVLASIYSLITPSFEAPDEMGHLQYVAYLLRTRTLPRQRIGDLGQAHQPPLYYAIAALASLPVDPDDPAVTFRLNPQFVWAGESGDEVNAIFHNSAETFPFRGQALSLHLARGVSVLMGMITVALAIAIGWEIFPDRPLVGLMAAALVAFNPQFLFISGAVNNDNLLVLAATGAWWQMLRTVKRPAQGRQWAYFGLWIAVGILAKTSGVVIGLVAGLVLLACAVQRRSLKLFVRGALAMSLVVVLITGWWFARNQLLYGDPYGWTMYQKVGFDDLRKSPLQRSDLHDFFSMQFHSFWGLFGWMNILAPFWFYMAARILSLLGLGGIVVFALEGRFSELSGSQKRGLALLGVATFVQEVFLLGVITRCAAGCYQGRHLFPVIGPLMVLMSLGIMSLLPRRAVVPLVSGLTLILVGVALFVPLEVIRPAYPTVPLPKWSLWFLPHKTELAFGHIFALKGYELQAGRDGSQTILTLYWQAMERPDFDYSVFVHLIDESNQLIAQRDHAPGDDRGYPPTAWWPEDIIADEHPIEIPPQLPSGTYRFRVGVYDWVTGERLPALLKSEPMGSFVILDQVVYP